MVSTVFSTKPKEVEMDNQQNGSDSKDGESWGKRCYQVAKLLFCLFLLVVSGFQVAGFISMLVYRPFHVQTNVRTNIAYPKSMDLPGITVCNNNRLQKSKVCQVESKFCNDTVNPKETYQFIYGKSASQIVPYAQTEDEFIENCFTVNNDYASGGGCGNASRIYFEPLINCFTLFSKWGENQKRNEDISYFGDAVGIHLDFQKEEYTERHRQVGGIFFVHDTHSLPDLESLGDEIKPGYLHSITIEKTTYHRLQEPYPTKCRYYGKHPQNDVQIDQPKSQKQCYSECLHNTFIEKCGCMPLYQPQVKAKNQGNCDFGNTTFGTCYSNHVSFLTEQCRRACPLSCREDEYKMKVERLPITPNEELNETTSNGAILYVRFASHKHIIYRDIPNNLFTWREVSLMSLWAVVSIVSLSQVFFTALTLCDCRSKKNTILAKKIGNDVTAVVGIDIDINGSAKK